MGSNRFTNEWYIAYMAKLKAKPFAGVDRTKPAEDVPDPGLEKKLQKRVMDYCKENGWPCFHDRSRGVNEPGWIDCFIFLPGGRVVLIELKSAGGKFRKEQLHLRRVLGYNDHMVYIARSFKRVVEIIQAELKKGEK